MWVLLYVVMDPGGASAEVLGLFPSGESAKAAQKAAEEKETEPWCYYELQGPFNPKN